MRMIFELINSIKKQHTKNSRLSWVLLVFVAFLTLSMSNATQNNSYDTDYTTAISIAEAHFPDFKLKRADYKLIKIENELVGKVNILNWKLTFKDKKLFSKDGLIGKGGEVFIEVNLEDKNAKIIGYGE